jgi:hypothetical protein
MHILQDDGILMRLLVYVVLALSAAVPAIGESSSKQMTDNYFCLHVHSHHGYEKAFSQVPFGMLRTWDSSIGWPQIEPEKGKWNWELLDNYVRLARKNNVRLLMTLGMTPLWAAKNPDAPSPYGGVWSSSPPRDIADWEIFIRNIADRNERVYGGAIRYWEIWNEPDSYLAGYEFYTGSVEELIEMARVAHAILKEANPGNMMLSPGITQVGQSWLDRFLKGGGSRYVDIIGFHFYWVWYPPSIPDFEPAFSSLKKTLERNGCADKPIWVTETGFDVNRFDTTDKRNMALAAVILAPRYFGADVACVYSWNSNTFTVMYDSGEQKLTETGVAYIELHKWLDGAAIAGLRPGKANSRVVTLENNGNTARIVWRYGTGKMNFMVDAAWGDSVYNLDGTNSPIPANRIIALGNSPVLIGNVDYFSQNR